MPLSICTYPDPILEEPCEDIREVTDDIQKLGKEMLELMVAEDGVGLAAPQVGHSIRMFVVDVWWPTTGNTTQALTFINPRLTFGKNTQRKREGCLSFPGLSEYVTRAGYVQVEALGLDGKPFSINASGLLAVAIQHENDHLDGITFLNRMGPTARRMALKSLSKGQVV